MWGLAASLRLSPVSVLVGLNSFLNFPQRKAGFVLQWCTGWQWPCVLSEAQATCSVGQTVFALHGFGPVDILLFRLPNCKWTATYSTLSAAIPSPVFLPVSSASFLWLI